MRSIHVIGAAALLLFAVMVVADTVPEKRFTASVGPDGVQRVEMAGGEYYFDPNYVIVTVNVPVELVVKKAGGAAPHNIVIKAPDAGIDFSETLAGERKSSRSRRRRPELMLLNGLNGSCSLKAIRTGGSRTAHMPSYTENWGFLSLDIASLAVGMIPM